MIPPSEAWERLEPFLTPLAPEELPRREARDRVLARSLSATVDVPPADVSAMDGYALAGPPGRARHPVTGSILAGEPPGSRLTSGTAKKIMTGAPIPEAADRVIQVELASREGDDVRFERDLEAGANIRAQGEVLRTGDPLLPGGARLTPGALALLATHGYGSAPVHRAPRVAMFSTGDEVVPPDAEPGPGQLRDSHTDFTIAAVGSLGLPVETLGIATDDPDDLTERLRRGLASSDVLLVTGGVSMGDRDLVEPTVRALGGQMLFHGVAVQPGKPLLAASHPGGLVFGLPGNPASVMVCFWLFVRPVLRRLLGHRDGYWHGALTAELDAHLPRAKTRDRFLPAELVIVAGTLRAHPVATVGSHDLAAYARGTALVRIPADSPERSTGTCEVLPIG